MDNRQNDMLTQLRQNRIILVIGIVCGLAGAGMIYWYLTDRDRELRDTVAVAAVNADIPKGRTVTSAALVRKSVPRGFVPPNVIAWGEAGTIEGTRTLVTLHPGQVLTWDFVEVTTLQRSFSDRIDSTQRAVTVAVDNESGVAGAVVPGDRVDVMGMFTVTAGKRQGTTVAKTLLQCVPVLDVGNRGARSGTGYGSVTLMVSPLEAELLFFAENQGKLKLLLRNRTNIGIEDIGMVDFTNLEIIQRETRKRKALRVRYGDGK